MKIYKPLPIPLNSSWDKKTWRYYTPIWFDNFVDNINNLITWFPVIWKDRNWDDHYIFEILKHKLYLQRKYLVYHNRTTKTEEINRYITICLNLIERIQTEHYLSEYQNYYEDDSFDHIFEPELPTPKFNILDRYFKKYSNAYKKIMKDQIIKDRYFEWNEFTQALALSNYNQDRCQSLLFKILDEKINMFWD